jgi:hypothetical protein
MGLKRIIPQDMGHGFVDTFNRQNIFLKKNSQLPE